MERYQALIKEAQRNFQLADYMINVTYPKISDPKMLLSAMDSLFLATDYSMSSILYYERFLKRLPPFHDSFENKFHLFKENCVRRYKYDVKTITHTQIREQLKKARSFMELASLITRNE